MSEKELPIFESLRAGFPSPAEDFNGSSLNITDLLIKNPESTFYARVKGDSMNGDGIDDGDILVIDKGEELYDNCIAVCFIDGEFTIKRVRREKDYILLIPSNKKYQPIKVTKDNEFIIWGIARFLIKKL